MASITKKIRKIAGKQIEAIFADISLIMRDSALYGGYEPVDNVTNNEIARLKARYLETSYAYMFYNFQEKSFHLHMNIDENYKFMSSYDPMNKKVRK